MIEIDLIQGSEEWKSWRNNKITASDIPIIMGESPWCTPLQLWKRKLRLIPPVELNDAMRRGMALEEEARREFNKTWESEFLPKVIQSSEIEYMAASLDGMRLINWKPSILEIKCMGKKNHEKFMKDREIPKYYFGQLQHQMYVCECNHIIFLAYSEESNLFTIYYRDQDYIKRMLVEAEKFWNCLQALTPPDLTEMEKLEMEF